MLLALLAFSSLPLSHEPRAPGHATQLDRPFFVGEMQHIVRQDQLPWQPSETATPVKGAGKSPKELDRAVIRFAGDSGDGMQLTGEQFTTESAWAGNDLATLPNFPAEIRAPAGTLFGVSSYQLQFGSHRVYTPGDRLDCLVAMNPAALKVHLSDLKPGGLLIVNTAAFEVTRAAALEVSP